MTTRGASNPAGKGLATPSGKPDPFDYCRAYDKLTEARSRLDFILEAAPLTSNSASFSREGFEGLIWMLIDVSHKLKDSAKILKVFATTDQRRAI